MKQSEPEDKWSRKRSPDLDSFTCKTTEEPMGEFEGFYL